MGHFAKIAVEVIGVAVAIAAAIPTGGASAAVGGTVLASALGVSAATASAIAAGTGLAAATFGALTAKKPTSLANPTEWQSDPQAGVPHVGGRMFVAGQIVYRATFGKDNVNQTINTIYSTGPIMGFEGWYFSGVLSPIDGNGHPTNVVDGQKIYLGYQLGRQPEPTQLAGTNNPGITAMSKLSGLAASTITLSYDTTGKHTFTTEPQIGAVVRGTPIWDPRQDSTYPGGSADGAQRSSDETTWSFTHYDNPGLKALAWLIGYRQNSYVVAGVGLPTASINVAQFVEMANVCDANGWTCGFEAKSTDNPWQVFTQILQAGGAVPTRSGAVTGCMVNTPKVSLATFEIGDIIGDWSIQATQSRRDRINAIVPRYMAEQSLTGETTDSSGNVVLQTTVTWGMQPAGAIAIASYAAEDGGQRLKGVDYPFVTGVSTNGQAPNQVAQLARYDIENAREFGPISLPMKPRWMGYRAGDVITGGASVTELGLVGQDIMIMQRQFSPANMTVMITARSETAAKHAFALGQTTTAPPTPMLSGPPLIPVPGAAAWALTAGEVTSVNGTTGAALFLNGSPDSQVIDAIVVEMRVSTEEQDATADWEGVTTLAASFSGQLTITGVQDHTAYQVAVSYRKGPGTSTRLILGPATAGQTAVPYEAGVVGPKPPVDADNTSATFQALDTGRSPQQVLDDLDLGQLNILGQAVQLGQYKVATDQLIIGPDGTPIGVTLTAVQTMVNGQQATYAQLVRTDDGVFRAVATINEAGVITGTESLVDNGKGEYWILADIFGVIQSDGTGLVKPFVIENGIAYFDHVKVRQLDADVVTSGNLATNAAMVPVRAAATSAIGGTHTGGHGTVPTTASVLSTTIVMPKAGWIEVSAAARQSFNGALTSVPWLYQILIDGQVLPESAFGGEVPGDSTSPLGAMYVQAGSHTVQLYWNAHSSITLTNRSLFAKGFPSSE